MPTNLIIVELEQGVIHCRIWDGEGTEHDVSEIFQEIRDQSTKQNWATSLTFCTSSLSTAITLPGTTKKEASFEVADAVIKQILQML